MIDFTAYIGHFPYWENKYAEPSGEGILTLMDREGIDKAIVISLRAIFDNEQSGKGNEEVFKAAERYPGRFIPAVTINPYSVLNDKGYLTECRQAGAKVLALFPYFHLYPLASLCDDRLDSMIRCAQDLGFCVSLPLRLFMNWYFNGLPLRDVALFVSRNQGGAIVIDCFNYGEQSAVLEIANKFKNVYAATSALSSMGGIETLVSVLGEDRVLAGTCAPLQIPACGIVKITESNITEACRNKILDGNAATLLGELV
jgi:predicted TIM-barrel fold metal-dependent hydrolase